MTGTMRGYRIFTACRTVNKKKFFHLEDNIDRLFSSAQEIFMSLPHSKNNLYEILQRVLEKNKDVPGELLLQIIYTGGRANPNGLSPAGNAELIVLAFPLPSYPAWWYEKGIALATYLHQRALPTVKYLWYMPAVIAHQTVAPQFNAQEILFVCPQDGATILEGATFNIFMVDKNGTILTPPANGRILPGVTRGIIFSLGKKWELLVREQTISLNDVLTARELFLTSSTRNIVPVTRVNDQVIGNGIPGPQTKLLLEKINEYQQKYAPAAEGITFESGFRQSSPLASAAREVAESLVPRP